MKKLIIAAILAILQLLDGVYAQQVANHQIYISGKVVDNSGKRDYSQMLVSYSLNDWFGGVDKQQYLYPKIDSNGHFDCKLPDLNKPYKIGLVIYSTDGSKKIWNGHYYANSKDSIQFQIKLTPGQDSVTVTGNGAESYRLIDALAGQWDEYYAELNKRKKVAMVSSLAELNTELDDIASLLRKYKLKKKQLIASTNINDTLQKIITYEFAPYNNEWKWRTQLFYEKYPGFGTEVFAIYNRYKSEFSDEISDLGISSPSYVNHLTSRILLELSMSNGTNKANINSFFKVIKEQYSGKLRNRLFGIFAISPLPLFHFAPFSDSVRDSLLYQAESLVVDPVIKNSIQEKIRELKLVKGKIISATFFNADNSKFELKELIGKVYLIDVWFRGCTGCALFHRSFEKDIYPKFKKNANFKVLSINIDRKRQNWITGMADDKYTSDKYINVTTGNGLDHPFMKKYGVKGGPYLMLVDSVGNIVQQFETVNIQDMIKKIDTALDACSIKGKAL